MPTPMRNSVFRSAAKAVYPLLLTLALSSTAKAQTFTVLHTFHGYDGAGPFGQLLLDSSGNIYGTTEGGGVVAAISPCGSSGCGTAFMLNKTGKQIWQHNFNGRNGEGPLAGLLGGAAGTIYGTTYLGGDTTCYRLGCGTVFTLDEHGKEHLLYQFTGTPDGWFPQGPLTQDTAGNLYGTTQQGGSSGGYGTIYKVDATGAETVLYSFSGGLNGCYPDGGVTRDAMGNLYGVAAGCTGGYGEVFELDPSGNLTVLHAFGGRDGANPTSPLIFDAAGNLYGTTSSGGSSSVCNGGCGTVFELSPNGNGIWIETVLYSFCSLEACADGDEPSGGLVKDNGGNLYGVTVFGGKSRCFGGGCGVVFELNGGNETVLHSFTGGVDGFQPGGALAWGSYGALYGVATGGGDTNCFPPDGCGIVYVLTP